MTLPALQLANPSKARKSNLAFALHCLPPDRRVDSLIFYDFCRAVDDIADGPLPPDRKRALLKRWKDAVMTDEGLPKALAAIIERRTLERTLLQQIVEGVEMDIEPHSYKSYKELRAYCWRVACAVGLVSTRIFGCVHPESSKYAEYLGYALQLTNILRDVGEDARMGRIYLPQEDRAHFRVSEESILALRPNGDFEGLMDFQAMRALSLYEAAEQCLPKVDSRALLPAETMRKSYRRILSRMRDDGFRVFSKRYRLSPLEKAGLATGALARSLFSVAAAN